MPRASPPHIAASLSASDVATTVSITVALIFAILAVGFAASALRIGPIAHHMVQHIVLMNAVAPAAAYLALAAFDQGNRNSRRRQTLQRSPLFTMTIAQIALIWAWHLPPVFNIAASRPIGLLAMHISLLSVAFFFWLSALRTVGSDQWRSIASLLVTGKFFCLLGILLALSPRALYADSAVAQLCLASGVTARNILEDQQMSGLVMIVACPLTYVVAGVIIAERWLRQMRETQFPPSLTQRRI